MEFTATEAFNLPIAALRLKAELIPKAPPRPDAQALGNPLRTQAGMFRVSAHPRDAPLRRNASCFQAGDLGQRSGAAFIGVILLFAKAVH